MKKERTIQCRTCSGLMTEKVIKGVTVDECLKCKDVWFDSGEVERYLAESGKYKDSILVLKEKISKDKKPVLCSVCNTENFRHIGSEVLQTGYCKKCDGFYLNHNLIEEYTKKNKKGDGSLVGDSFFQGGLEIIFELLVS